MDKRSNPKKDDDAWQKICDRTDLLQQVKKHGFFLVSAKTLQQISDERQPRLMAKFDFDHQRPAVFKKLKLNILPLKRGEYVVFHDPDNDCYFDLPQEYNSREPKPYCPAISLKDLDTLGRELCSTESDALELAALSSLLSTFCSTKNLTLTKRGRFGSSSFEMQLPGCKSRVLVASSQIEVDGIYESSEVVALVEAKIGFHQNFNIRQLYYPYKWLCEKTKKRIVPILLCYSAGEFQLTEFSFGAEFGQIEKKRQEYFVIQEDSVVLVRGDLGTVARYRPSPEEDLGTPFPQADDMDKVVDVVRLAQREICDDQRLVDILGFVHRQAGYYRNAARYLGFTDGASQLTVVGAKLLSLRHRLDRTELIMNRMFTRPVLREAIMLLIKRDYSPTAIQLFEIEALIEKWRPGEYSDETLKRRALTVRNWLKWLVANCDLPTKRA